VKKFLRRLELIKTNVETSRNDLPATHDTFRRKQDVKCGWIVWFTSLCNAYRYF